MAGIRNPYDGTLVPSFLDIRVTTTATDTIKVEIVDNDGTSVPGVRAVDLLAVDSVNLNSTVDMEIDTAVTGAVIGYDTVGQVAKIVTDANGVFQCSCAGGSYIASSFCGLYVPILITS